jgi:putative SOS response-associated peptidase YedK
VKDNNTASKIRQRTLNARAETIFTKPAFRHSIRLKRCLVIADGFFEWRHENNKKYPYYIRLTNHMPFAIAGIWDSWVNDETGENIRTFSVITTQANLLLEIIHNTRKRMPVILRREDENQWLEDGIDENRLQSMLSPYSMEEMEAYTVPKQLSKLGFNTMNPEVLNAYDYKDLPNLGKSLYYLTDFYHRYI